MLELIGFDFDDTLAANQHYFQVAEDEFFEHLETTSARPEGVAKAREEFKKIENEYLPFCGFGVGKLYIAFANAAARFTPEAVNAGLIEKIDEISKRLRNYPIIEYDDVRAAFERLNERQQPYIIITKGEPFHQHDKLAAMRKNLDAVWKPVDERVVGLKDDIDYSRILREHRVEFVNFCMIGDSYGSDIEPVLKKGGHGVLLARPGTPIKALFDRATAGNLTPEMAARLRLASNLTESLDAAEALLRQNKLPEPISLAA